MLSKENLSAQSAHKISQVARRFVSFEGSFEVKPLGQGNINQTYLVTSEGSTFILQCISSSVFNNPRKVADNSAKIAAHVAARRLPDERVNIPVILKALSGDNYVEDDEGLVWRAQSYIVNSRVHQSASSPGTAFEVGKCLARFHSDVEEIPLDALDETLPGFHYLPGYIKAFDETLSTADLSCGEEIKFCLKSVEQGRREAFFFEQARQRQEVSSRIVHGDPKLSNVLFNSCTDRAIAMIDLDTVGPGLLLCDIGDCLRSISCSSENHFNKTVHCNTEMVAAALKGYTAAGKLTDFEKESVYKAFYLITFELGLRFFTDYIKGNRYFTIQYPEQNLYRAMVQFRLVESIVRQRQRIENIAGKL